MMYWRNAAYPPEAPVIRAKRREILLSTGGILKIIKGL